ncbi:MAG: nucleotide sugar dehydrogenase [Chitinophagia bacterium]|nr:nucleotide sugar dehydrogenase [Chitinophagia bacterium]
MKQEKIAIIGLGYVGLPLAVAFSTKYPVIGFDINPDRIADLSAGLDRTNETSPAELQEAVKNGLSFTHDEQELSECNFFIVTVPTPIDAFNAPNLQPLLAATETIGKYLKKEDIVVYESTTYPGCTEEDCVPVLEKISGLTYNKDFYCGYSPERINPGDKINTLTKIKKVTSGSTPQIAQIVDQLYASIIEAGTHMAPSIKVAEASKAIENAQRDVNISFVNELALIFDRMGIDTKHVLEAASTKWNFLPFKPGLVGGHCISVDPFYLAYKAERSGYVPKVILSGRAVNESMPGFVAEKLIRLMQQKGTTANGSRVLILGITFKENCPDVRNSKIPSIKTALEEAGIEVDIHDPWADPDQVAKEFSINLADTIPQKYYDGILVCVPHDAYLEIDFNSLFKVEDKGVLFDLKGIVPNADARL